MGLDYATRFVADRGGIDPPDVRRCGDSTIRFMEPEAADDRTHLVVRVQSSEASADGVPCRDGVVMTVTHWMDRVSFRPFWVLLEAVPLDRVREDNVGAVEGLLYWGRQTVYSDDDVRFDIEPPT